MHITIMYLKRCINSVKNIKQFDVSKSRNYHSENVFGYRRKTRKEYKVPEDILRNRNKESNFYRLVTAYRQHGHRYSDINPVLFKEGNRFMPEIELCRYELSKKDIVEYKGIFSSSKERGSVEEAVEILDQVYSRHIAGEFCYLEDEQEKEWLAEQLEYLPSKCLSSDTKVRILNELLQSQSFDHFMAKKFQSVKRYGAEGAESMMAFYSTIFRLSAQDSIEQIVLAMAHRGRLNILTGMLDFPPSLLFHKLLGHSDIPKKYKCTGDVISHCISSTHLQFDDNTVHVSLLYNPSHLEAINSVSMGKTRAKQMLTKDGDYGENIQWSSKVLNIQVHGDAALAGQGINQECLMLSRAPHFEIGGTIHLVINNQVGFTTPADRGRSSRYCTDLAKVISAPVIHVNGDFPEDVARVTQLAFEFQRKFRKDIFIDLNCYRLWGHNELDDPTFTNPSLYSVIKSKKNVPDLYADKLKGEGLVTDEICNKIVEDRKNWLNEHLDQAIQYVPQDSYFKGNWHSFSQATEAITTWNTGIDFDLLTFIGTKSVQYPESFVVHPTLLRTHVKNRLNKIAEGTNIDWSTAETLAFGSLLLDSCNVRISGQDVGRGTFSHRHVMLVDQKTNSIFIPLNNIQPKQNYFLEIANSILSEEAVLGYEYGMSVETPKNLVIWEAQFGDFFNGAQIIFDTFISSGETKWLWQSGLTILLPHGYDGAGPEHSSSRVERFLQLTDSKENQIDSDDVNMQVCQPSTPAQYFHLLRRQMVRNYRKPLIIITPKTLLRDSACISNFSDMVPKTHFFPVIGDFQVTASQVRKILLTSGKHYYSLAKKRESMGVKDVAIVRLESFCPFPLMELRNEISRFSNARVTMWCQEEPKNMGAWTFVKPRFENLIGKQILYCGRPTAAAPAVGIKEIHEKEVQDILSRPFML